LKITADFNSLFNKIAQLADVYCLPNRLVSLLSINGLIKNEFSNPPERIMSITIGLQLAPQFGEMNDMRRAWMQAEELGADVLYSSDHFNAMVMDEDHAKRTTHGEEYGKINRGKCFEGTTIQAAMAATTTRPRIGAIVHANSYRNPNLMADIARTIDHISGGRFILGMGTGYLKEDYEDYGYHFGTQKERSLAFARDIPIIKDRFKKLNPPPIGNLPLLVASMGPTGMKVAAEYADMWHVYGPAEKIQEKCAQFRETCESVGRNYDDIELVTYYFPQMLGGIDTDPSIYPEMGIRHIVVVNQGPKWDLGQLKEVLQWRDSLR
jgi:alkanesulfonate monooxygenase SsuD/methylene tetrahydromethanopterin reductase-like flavin-dependent oxidoreductase (luciferase family)